MFSPLCLPFWVSETAPTFTPHKDLSGSLITSGGTSDPQDQSVCLIQSLTLDPLQLHPPLCSHKASPTGGMSVCQNCCGSFPLGDEIILVSICNNKEDELQMAGHAVSSKTKDSDIIIPAPIYVPIDLNCNIF